MACQIWTEIVTYWGLSLSSANGQSRDLILIQRWKAEPNWERNTAGTDWGWSAAKPSRDVILTHRDKGEMEPSYGPIQCVLKCCGWCSECSCLVIYSFSYLNEIKNQILWNLSICDRNVILEKGLKMPHFTRTCVQNWWFSYWPSLLLVTSYS